MSDAARRFSASALTEFGTRTLEAIGCRRENAALIADHLVEADLCGVSTHGIFRLAQYAEQAQAGWYDPAGHSRLTQAEGGAPLVDGGNALGIPAMILAADCAIERASRDGVAAVGVANVAHTGRIGAYAERMASRGHLAIVFGGGSRKEWRQVVPHGGAHALLPTNPFAFALPGDEGGPVSIDFATSAGSGGKIYAARELGEALPAGLCVDAQGRPTRDPEDYFNGGALLPMAGPRGYGMALIAELLGEAIFGEAKSGMNWICIAIDLARWRRPDSYRAAAAACLAELRACPPAPGFARVEIPGQREAALKAERRECGVPLEAPMVAALRSTAVRLGVEPVELDSPLAP